MTAQIHEFPQRIGDMARLHRINLRNTVDTIETAGTLAFMALHEVGDFHPDIANALQAAIEALAMAQITLTERLEN